jgi:hypothetical protein
VTLIGAFATDIKAGPALVVVSTAMCHVLDPNYPAAFSLTIVTGIAGNSISAGGELASPSSPR